MKTLQALYHLARADYLERIRRSTFLLLLGSTILAAYLFTPAANAGYATLEFAREGSGIWYRGVYNSAWVATQVSLWATIWLTLIGFFFVSNAVERDVQTGVGQILATTPLSKFMYILGKTFSNLAVLASVPITLVFATLAMQLLRGESYHVDAWQLLSPFILLLLPTITVVAALAVLFECVTWLRGTVGSVVYIFLYCFILFLSFGDGQAVNPYFDMLGTSYSIQQMQTAVHAAVPNFTGTLNVGISPINTPPHTFVWQGTQWTWAMVNTRLLWLAVAFVLVILATFFFSRFDTAKERKRNALARTEQAQEIHEAEEHFHTQTPPLSLSPLPAHSRSGIASLGAILLGELRLLGKDVPWWWYIGALLWIILCLFLPFDVARGYMFPLAWLWPLPIWSSLGNREKRSHTQQFIFAAPRMLQRQFLLLYFAGVCFTLLAASGMLVRYLLVGEMAPLIALVLGALFIPALALACGVWTSGKRLFELVFVALWYVGTINRTSALDFMGITDASLVMHIPYIFAAITFVLLLCSFGGRKLQAHV